MPQNCYRARCGGSVRAHDYGPGAQGLDSSPHHYSLSRFIAFNHGFTGMLSGTCKEWGSAGYGIQEEDLINGLFVL